MLGPAGLVVFVFEFGRFALGVAEAFGVLGRRGEDTRESARFLLKLSLRAQRPARIPERGRLALLRGLWSALELRSSALRAIVGSPR